MGNLRDGGVVVIGASEENGTWLLTGIEPGDLNTYDIDTIRDVMAKYASPAPEVDVVLVDYHAPNPFLALEVSEFRTSPFVCRKDSPQGVKHSFSAGDVFLRPPGKPQTKPVSSASEMHDLLELTAEKRARQMLQTARRIGLSSDSNAAGKFDEELRGL